MGLFWGFSSSLSAKAPINFLVMSNTAFAGGRHEVCFPLDNPAICLTPFPVEPCQVSPERSLSLSLVRAKNLAAIAKTTIRENQLEESSSTPSFLKPAVLVAGALGITAILIRSDQQTYNTLYDWKQSHAPLRDVSPIITNFGDGRSSMAIFGSFLAYSYLGNDRTAFQAGKIGIESFLVSGIVTQILKHTFGRERPSVATENGGRWNGAFLLLNRTSGKRGTYSHYDAFPSGHTATAFAAATTLSDVYHDSPWVSYASYSIASGVAISRVMEKTHWLSDCFIGGLIGYFSAKFVINLNHSQKPVAFIPITDGKQVGFALNMGF